MIAVQFYIDTLYNLLYVRAVQLYSIQSCLQEHIYSTKYGVKVSFSLRPGNPTFVREWGIMLYICERRNPVYCKDVYRNRYNECGKWLGLGSEKHDSL